jgi:formylmethanofuran dehydrogenase subunit B
MGQRAGMTQPAGLGNVTCLGCGCACDDIEVVVAGDRIVEARNACQLGLRWFGDGQVPSAIRVDGAHVSIEQAVSAAATRLCEAARPLVYLAPGLSCETQREAVSVADLLRARLDSITSSTALPFTLASQEHGSASATLGEIRNRADLVVFWGIDLESRYPRFASRYAPEPPGVYLPHGRRSRTVIAVDIGRAKSTVDADLRLVVEPANELATLTALEALARSADTSGRYAALSDPAWVAAREMASALLAARYIALVYDAEPDDRSERTVVRFEAFASLAQTLNDRTRCAALALRAGGNRSGADSVLVAQTGYPCAIDFARGYPRYDPHTSSALTGPRGHHADAVLVAGDPTGVPSDFAAALPSLHTMVVGPHASALTLGRRSVVIDTGLDGIHASGTALRTDDVPLPLRVSLPGPRSTAEIVRGLASGIRRLLLPARGVATAELTALDT